MHAMTSVAGHSSQLTPLHKDGTALRLAAEKRAAVVMEGCAFSALAQTAVQGFAAGWEIPVTVLPADRFAVCYVICSFDRLQATEAPHKVVLHAERGLRHCAAVHGLRRHISLGSGR